MKNMVRLVGVLAVAILAATQARAIIYAQDDFSYPDGDLTNSSSWYTFSGSTPLNVSSQQAIVTGANSADDALDYAGVHTNDVIYGHAEINFSDAGSGTTYFMNFKQQGSFFYVGKVFGSSDGSGGVTLGISSSANSPDVTWASSLSLNTTYDICFKIDQTGADAVMTLWVNPANEASTSIVSSDASPYHDDLNSIALRQGSGFGTVAVDNLKVGTSFAEVCVIPEPSTILLVVTGLLGLLAFRRRS